MIARKSINALSPVILLHNGLYSITFSDQGIKHGRKAGVCWCRISTFISWCVLGLFVLCGVVSATRRSEKFWELLCSHRL